MAKRYLLSSVELNVRTSVYEEVFYTVDNNLNLVSIGGVKDFTKGFNADVLATIDNTVYSQLNEGKVYVVDSRKNSITAFKQTEFGEIVQEAIYLFNEGLYDEAKEPWEEVLRRDSNYWLAYIGLGNAYLNQGDYQTAMDYFYRNSRGGYNRAFKSYRIEFIRANFTWMMIIVLVLILGLVILSYVRKYLKKKKAGKNKGGNQ